MEGLAQGGTEVPFGVCGQAGEPESGRVSVPDDARQHEQAMDPLVIDTAAKIGVRNLGSHLRQPGQQKRRDLVELLIEDGRPPETDQILRAPGFRPPPREAIPAAPPTALHQGTLPQRDKPGAVRLTAADESATQDTRRLRGERHAQVSADDVDDGLTLLRVVLGQPFECV